MRYVWESAGSHWHARDIRTSALPHQDSGATDFLMSVARAPGEPLVRGSWAGTTQSPQSVFPPVLPDR